MENSVYRGSFARRFRFRGRFCAFRPLNCPMEIMDFETLGGGRYFSSGLSPSRGPRPGSVTVKRYIALQERYIDFKKRISGWCICASNPVKRTSKSNSARKTTSIPLVSDHLEVYIFISHGALQRYMERDTRPAGRPPELFTLVIYIYGQPSVAINCIRILKK